ncbi:MAG TPA: hypothetical protein GXZ56_00505 [Bacteroidales bacterium]|jgi:hypothetical protein|nr:hypothetical protein [Bacteroidales bacterium]HHV04100.1 hypothetical protein [Bacteroidales bacterium]
MKKKSNNWNLLWNPFTRVAGWQAFWVGMVIVVASALLASYGNLLFDGAIDAHFHHYVGIAHSFVVTGISLLSVVAAMYVAALIISRSVRFIDILGTMTLARAPFLLLAIISPFVSFPSMDLLIQDPLTSFGYPMLMYFVRHPMSLIFIIISLPVIVWLIALMYNGFKVSTGAKGKKLVVAFIVALLIAEVLSKVCIYLLPF